MKPVKSPHKEIEQDRGERICEMIRRLGPLTSTQISRRLDINWATSHRILGELVKKRWLKRNKRRPFVFTLTKKGLNCATIKASRRRS